MHTLHINFSMPKKNIYYVHLLYHSYYSLYSLLCMHYAFPFLSAQNKHNFFMPLLYLQCNHTFSFLFVRNFVMVAVPKQRDKCQKKILSYAHVNTKNDASQL